MHHIPSDADLVFGKWLENKIKEREVSQTALATLVGMSQTNISRAVRGIRRIEHGEFERISEALSLTQREHQEGLRLLQQTKGRVEQKSVIRNRRLKRTMEQDHKSSPAALQELLNELSRYVTSLSPRERGLLNELNPFLQEYLQLRVEVHQRLNRMDDMLRRILHRLYQQETSDNL